MDYPAERVQRFERKSRHFNRRKLRRPRFSHPGRQQPPRAIRVVDNKVRAAPVSSWRITPMRSLARGWWG